MVSDPFLSDSRKRKRPTTMRAPHKKQATPTPDKHDVEITDSESENDEQGNVSANESEEADEDALDSEEEFQDESAADKRRRLAKQYLDNLKLETMAGDNYDFDAQDLDDDILASRLQRDVAENKGMIYKFFAASLIVDDEAIRQQFTRIGSKGLTGVSVCYPHAYTVSKDMELIKWNIDDKNKKAVRVKHTKGGPKFAELASDPSLNGHSDEILCVAASPDGKYVVTGGRDNRIIVWSTESLTPVKVLETRKGGVRNNGDVLAMVFRRNSDQLYVACADLRIRTYSINQMAQLETLYGHQDLVVDISSLIQERCVTVGSRDKTAMLWKISEESRLTFRGGDTDPAARRSSKYTKDKSDKPKDVVRPAFYAEGSMDCVSMLDDTHFVTGSDNGNISLWSLAKKKALYTMRQAHGLIPQERVYSAEAEYSGKPEELPPKSPYWITSIYALPYSDIFVSGSWDGKLRLWKLEANLRQFTLLKELDGAKGLVTKLEMFEGKSDDGEYIKVVGSMSKEHRLGRWCKVPGGRNALYSAVIAKQK
ncbi:hypothetical protein BABINDRAFT_161594 [Babjeviella inositovora NRRL Y-12698]|uniref:Uncharacterized protein n=1 Tax=Babjeviella inositovora NRRL Y-12698 TaxID=984486 RepID=A0A1E3QQL1_9ASCO|nr:uncharacterized protein BABINDRAFT_161594 [Babjeviella inositovora NRRL Y-12698]ODQ79928.1 hypothetical protein BABINDRAFT_161594 [Babjeviella inositovora NRRL Y-12698]